MDGLDGSPSRESSEGLGKSPPMSFFARCRSNGGGETEEVLRMRLARSTLTSSRTVLGKVSAKMMTCRMSYIAACAEDGLKRERQYQELSSEESDERTHGVRSISRINH